MFPLFLNAGSASKVLGIDVYGKRGIVEGSPNRWWMRPLYHGLYRASDSMWWLKYRFVKKHRHHLVDTKLSPGYYDIDTLMLHANMQLLCRYVEREYEGREKLQERIDWLLSEEAKQEITPIEEIPLSDFATSDIEALRIYDWWKEEYPADQKKYDEMLKARYSDGSWKDNWKKIEIDGETLYQYDPKPLPEGAPTAEELHALEQKIRADEQNMLISLIKIRGNLWT